MSAMTMSGLFFDQTSVASVPGGKKSSTSGESFPYNMPMENFMNIMTNNTPGSMAWSSPTNSNCELLFLVMATDDTQSEYKVWKFTGDELENVLIKTRISSGTRTNESKVNIAKDRFDFQGTTDEVREWIQRETLKFKSSGITPAAQGGNS